VNEMSFGQPFKEDIFYQPVKEGGGGTKLINNR
jgi:hypothetical protein